MSPLRENKRALNLNKESAPIFVFVVQGGPVFGNTYQFRVGHTVKDIFATVSKKAVAKMIAWNNDHAYELDGGVALNTIAVVVSDRYRPPFPSEKSGHHKSTDEGEVFIELGKVVKIIDPRKHPTWYQAVKDSTGFPFMWMKRSSYGFAFYEEALDIVQPELRPAIERFFRDVPPDEQLKTPLWSWLIGDSTAPLKIPGYAVQYTDQTPKPSQTCNNCLYYYPAYGNQAVCSKIRNMVKPLGWCNLWRWLGSMTKEEIQQIRKQAVHKYAKWITANTENKQLKSAARPPTPMLIEKGQEYLKSQKKPKGKGWLSGLFGGKKTDSAEIEKKRKKLQAEKKEALVPLHKKRNQINRQLGRKDLKPDTKRDLESDLKKIEREYRSTEKKYDKQIAEVLKTKSAAIITQRVAHRYMKESSLKSRLIKLAYDNPDIRAEVLPNRSCFSREKRW